MKKLFGTDGIRAVAGEAPLDAKTIFATGLALAHSLGGKAFPHRRYCWARTRASPAPGFPPSSPRALARWRRGAERRCDHYAGRRLSHAHSTTSPPESSSPPRIIPGRTMALRSSAAMATSCPIERSWRSRRRSFAVSLSNPRRRHASEMSRSRRICKLRPPEAGVSPGIRGISAQSGPRAQSQGKKIVIDCANGAAAAIAPELFAGLRRRPPLDPCHAQRQKYQ